MLRTMSDHHVSVAISSQVRLEPQAVVRHVFHVMESIAAAWLLLLVAWTVAGLAANPSIRRVPVSAAFWRDSLRRLGRRTAKHYVTGIALGFTVLSLTWIVIGIVVSIATTPLILVVRKLVRDQHRHDLYLNHVVYPSVRKALLEKYGSATAADYREYLNEKLVENFWKPEVEDDLKANLKSGPKHLLNYSPSFAIAIQGTT